MNKKRLLFWAVLFSLLLLYVLLFETDKQKIEITDKEEIVRVFTVPQNKIRKIEVLHKNKKASLIKKGAKWKVVFPSASVQQELIESFISSIKDAVVIDVINRHPVNLDQYGLENPDIEIRVFTEGTNRAQIIFVGGNSPSGVSMYALLERSGVVILTGTYLRFSIKVFMGNL